MIKRFKSEKHLSNSFVTYLRSNKDDEVYAGVPCLSRCIDLLIVRRDQESIIAVELKLSNWRRALRQAEDHLLATNFSYVCMPKRVVSSACKEEFEKKGVGLWLFDRGKEMTLTEAIPAKESKAIWTVARGWLMASVAKRMSPRNEKTSNQTAAASC